MPPPTAPNVATDAQLIWQQCLFAFEEPKVNDLDTGHSGLIRTWLDETSWVDHVPRWLSGADVVFAELVAKLAWRQREVTMYDRRVAEPRLTAWWGPSCDEREPLPVLGEARVMLTRQYSRPFDSIGFNLYRDGRDSVAWHADRERYSHEDPVVAIVSTGAPRALHVRPKPTHGKSGPSRTWHVGQGDLLVMGGACQHDFEHCVPKAAHVEGPRLSIMFRHNMADWQPPDSGTYNQA